MKILALQNHNNCFKQTDKANKQMIKQTITTKTIKKTIKVKNFRNRQIILTIKRRKILYFIIKNNHIFFTQNVQLCPDLCKKNTAFL